MANKLKDYDVMTIILVTIIIIVVGFIITALSNVYTYYTAMVVLGYGNIAKNLVTANMEMECKEWSWTNVYRYWFFSILIVMVLFNMIYALIIIFKKQKQ